MIMIDVVMETGNAPVMSFTDFALCSVSMFLGGVLVGKLLVELHYRDRMLRYLAEIEYWSIRCTEMQQQLNEMERFKDGEDWKNE
jgi:hypothetical protein